MMTQRPEGFDNPGCSAAVRLTRKPLGRPQAPQTPRVLPHLQLLLRTATDEEG